MMESMKIKLFHDFICCKLFVSSEKFKGCFKLLFISTVIFHCTLEDRSLFVVFSAVSKIT